jgi:sugar-specific transcriptional regulator TrmB
MPSTNMESLEKIKEYIRKTGLTENESKIYLTLLEFGPNQAGIISRKSGLHRRVVYDTAEMLIKKGLIGYIKKNNKKLFQASNPNKILETIKEKEESINDILPQMLSMYNQTKEKEETNFYKGKNGLKTVFEDEIEEGKEILIISPFPLAYNILPFYFKWFDKRRQEKKIKARILFHKTNEQKIQKIPTSEIRILPEKYASPLAINVYGEKVAIILWSKENPFAVVIKNKEISDGYRKYFELMWKTAKK